jgi:hypothetical protein
MNSNDDDLLSIFSCNFTAITFHLLNFFIGPLFCLCTISIFPFPFFGALICKDSRGVYLAEVPAGLDVIGHTLAGLVAGLHYSYGSRATSLECNVVVDQTILLLVRILKSRRIYNQAQRKSEYKVKSENAAHKLILIFDETLHYSLTNFTHRLKRRRHHRRSSHPTILNPILMHRIDLFNPYNVPGLQY